MKYALWILLVLSLIIRLITGGERIPDGTKVRVKGKVASDPIKYSFYQSVALGNYKVFLPKFPEINYGDNITVEGKILEGKLEESSLIEIKENSGALYEVRKRIVGNYRKTFPEPHASLLSGVTLGIKSGIPVPFWESLKKTGTAHVVVASGMNVTLVAGLLVSFLTVVLSRKKAIPIAIIGIWVYALISGFDAPIIRASVMGTIAFVAQKTGRLTSAWRGLMFSLLVMLIIRPSWISDLGFILSFVATASILAFEPRFRKFLKFVPTFIREDLSTSLSAQIGVAPILFVTFGQFNILSPLINAMVAWTIAPMTIIAGLGGIISLILPGVGRLTTLLAYPFSAFFVGIVRIFG